VGVDRVVTLEAHNLAAFQNAFRCRTEHLEAHALFADHFADWLRERDLAVVSPDVGGIKRADRFREFLARRLEQEIPGAFVPEASRVLADAPLSRIAVLDHIPPFALERALVDAKLSLLDAAGLVAEAIRRLHAGGSLVELLKR